MNETIITVVGNLCDNPELRHLDSGIDVANFRLASTARRYDKETGTWVDSSALFLRVNCWRALATNVTASLHRGDAAVVTGRLTARPYTTQDGQPRTSFEIEATAVGPNLARGIVHYDRVPVGVAVGPAERDPEPAVPVAEVA